MAKAVLYREEGRPLLWRRSKTLGRCMDWVYEVFYASYHCLTHHSMSKQPESIGSFFWTEPAKKAHLIIAKVVLYREEEQPLLLRCSKTLHRCMGWVQEASYAIYHCNTIVLHIALCPKHRNQLACFLARANQEGTPEHAKSCVVSQGEASIAFEVFQNTLYVHAMVLKSLLYITPNSYTSFYIQTIGDNWLMCHFQSEPAKTEHGKSSVVM